MFFIFLLLRLFFFGRAFILIFFFFRDEGHHVETRKWGNVNYLNRDFISCPYLFLIGLISNVLNSSIPGLGVCNGYQKTNKKEKKGKERKRKKKKKKENNCDMLLSLLYFSNNM